MRSSTSLAPRWAVLSLALAAAGCAPAQAAPPDAALMARPPAISNVVLSPSGRRAAMIVADPNDGQRALAVVDLPPTAPPRIVASYGGADVGGAIWVNEDRLVYQAKENGLRIHDGGGGVFAVNHDGKDRTELIAYTGSDGTVTGSNVKSRSLNWEWSVIGRAAKGNGHEILVRENRYTTLGEWAGGKVARLDTRNGLLSTIRSGAPAQSHSWVFDAQGEVRVVRVTREGRDRLYLREGSSERWNLIADVPENDGRAMEPLLLEGSDQLIVRTRGGQETEGLYAYDLSKRALDPEPLARTARYDVSGTRENWNQDAVIAATLRGDRPISVWFSGKMAALQKAMDAALPSDRTNVIGCTDCESSAFYTVYSFSDRHPGEYLLYDAAQRKLLPLGQAYPWIDPATQGQRTFHWLQARDGLPLPVVVTHPPGRDPKTALPTVLLVHGGPWTEGATTAWNAEAQFLATRGYRVLEPQFRGTLGYGEKHFTASFKQWGGTMQDDLADTVRWAAQQGLTDPKRVCIYGASYGGYAALMSPVRDPDLYRCAASLVGVTDIGLMFTSNQSDLSRDYKTYGMKQMVGDPQADAAMLNASSPLKRVAEIKVPVLLAQGLLDWRVPREHADAYESAARKAGVNIERINYPEAGHGFSLYADKVDFWQHLDAFLARSLQP